MNKPNQLIIIGGGSSLREGISKSLWDKLKGRFTIGLNYSYKYYESTFQCYVDRQFYIEQKEELVKLPLIIGNRHQIPGGVLSNTTTFSSVNEYRRDVRSGCYRANLVGIYALSLGIYLLDKGEIFLLGYDFKAVGEDEKTKKPLTHFYQKELQHRGIGKVSYYNSRSGEEDFAPFKEEKKIKIWNVSLVSKIPIEIFEKISYDGFFDKLNKERFNQDKLRKEIKIRLSNS